MLRFVPLVVLTLVAVLPAPESRASLHPSEDSILVPVGPDGLGRELDFERQFKVKLIDRMNEHNPAIKDKDGKNPFRDRLVARIAERRRMPKRTPTDNALLASDLIRIGSADEAEAEVSRDRQGFLTNLMLAHIYANKGLWAKASEYLSIANEERVPNNVKELSGAHFDWDQKINRGPLAKLYESRGQEMRTKHDLETEDIDPIFDVKFVNEEGQYEPGKLAASEQKKLPPDAIAIVQQMMLWSPGDTRLYWQLGELYAAQGKFAEAKRIMDECTYEPRYYDKRKIFMQHREAVRIAAEAQAKLADAPVDDTPPAESKDKDVPIDIGAVWIYFGIVAVVVVLAVVRAATRKPRRVR